jgi:hypothetical protein
MSSIGYLRVITSIGHLITVGYMQLSVNKKSIYHPELVVITEQLLEWKSSGSGSRKPRLTAVGIRCADHAAPSIRKSWH